ncbi:hypothetical protein VBZ51_11195 [Maribacter sp. HS]|uniref:hypothetical protein n=1 Tax=Maribacter sp. HS TaxID=3110480 RepID=UPI003A897782
MKKCFVPICLLVIILSSCSKDEYIDITEEEQLLVNDENNDTVVDDNEENTNDLTIDSSILALPILLSIMPIYFCQIFSWIMMLEMKIIPLTITK